jgi:G3E family GTPase
MDDLFTLNECTPKIKSNGRSGVDPSLVFGLDSKLFALSTSDEEKARWTDPSHHQEVEIVTVRTRGLGPLPVKDNTHNERCSHLVEEADSLASPDRKQITREVLNAALGALNKDAVYRVKGFIRFYDEQPFSVVHILNWAFGRFELTQIAGDTSSQLDANEDVRLTVMGERGEIRPKARKLADALGAGIS